MEESILLKLRYPTGKFIPPDSYNRNELDKAIDELRNFPAEFRKTAESLSKDQLSKRYKPEGWTGRQVIHHVADSHSNALIRIKLALTEDNPTVKPYDENKWAMLADSIMTEIEPSLKMIEGLHTRLDILLRSLTDDDFNKTFYHPELKRTITVHMVTMLYRWHSYHHLGHLILIKQQAFS